LEPPTGTKGLAPNFYGKFEISKSFDMHVPHATNFYGKFENLNFDIFCKKKKVVPN
jgi:hypothetical protein